MIPVHDPHENDRDAMAVFRIGAHDKDAAPIPARSDFAIEIESIAVE